MSESKFKPGDKVIPKHSPKAPPRVVRAVIEDLMWVVVPPRGYTAAINAVVKVDNYVKYEIPIEMGHTVALAGYPRTKGKVVGVYDKLLWIDFNDKKYPQTCHAEYYEVVEGE